MDPFQLTICIIASVHVVCSCFFQHEIISRLGSIHRDEQTTHKHLFEMKDTLEKIRTQKPKQAKRNIFEGMKIDSAEVEVVDL